jgi:hypothetical protein
MLSGKMECVCGGRGMEKNASYRHSAERCIAYLARVWLDYGECSNCGEAGTLYDEHGEIIGHSNVEMLKRFFEPALGSWSPATFVHVLTCNCHGHSDKSYVCCQNCAEDVAKCEPLRLCEDCNNYVPIGNNLGLIYHSHADRSEIKKWLAAVRKDRFAPEYVYDIAEHHARLRQRWAQKYTDTSACRLGADLASIVAEYM